METFNVVIDDLFDEITNMESQNLFKELDDDQGNAPIDDDAQQTIETPMVTLEAMNETTRWQIQQMLQHKIQQKILLQDLMEIVRKSTLVNHFQQ